MTEQPQTELFIADRRQPGAESEIRRAFTEIVDAHFAKWLSSQERGQFLIITRPSLNMGDMFASAATEDELVEVIAQKFIAHCRAIGVSAPFRLHAWVDPQLLAKLGRLMDEIRQLVERRERRPGGNQGSAEKLPKLRVVK